MSSPLEIVNSHPRDERIRFVDETHTYYIDGSCAGYISSTTLVHTLFEKFDADKVIKKMRASRNWYKSPYKGMTNDDIKNKWEINRDSAATAGTEMHLQLENYYNKIEHEKDTKEFKMFENYVKDHSDLIPYRTEWVIFDQDSKVSGSIDMVYSRKNKDGETEYIIADWKRSKEIKKGNVYQSGTDEYTYKLEDCNYIHYSIQLAIYKYILERNYGIKISETFIVVLHPNQDKYLKIYTENMDHVVKNIMRRRSGKKKRKKCDKVEPCLFNMNSLKFKK